MGRINHNLDSYSIYHFTCAFISDVKIGGGAQDGGAVWCFIFGGVKLVLDCFARLRRESDITFVFYAQMILFASDNDAIKYFCVKLFMQFISFCFSLFV